MEEHNNILGQNIRRLRKARGYTLEQLGERLGVGKQTVHKYEDGTVWNIPIAQVIKIARVFDVSIDELVGYKRGEAPERRSIC